MKIRRNYFVIWLLLIIQSKQDYGENMLCKLRKLIRHVLCLVTRNQCLIILQFVIQSCCNLTWNQHSSKTLLFYFLNIRNYRTHYKLPRSLYTRSRTNWEGNICFRWRLIQVVLRYIYFSNKKLNTKSKSSI